MSRSNLFRFAIAAAGIAGFAILMALREEAHGRPLRAAIAGLAALIGVSSFLYALRARPLPRR
ncbi:MAG: hypothetical protein QM820_23215 [Minicystis sp.]